MQDDKREEVSVNLRKVMRRALAYLLLTGAAIAAVFWPLYAQYEDGVAETVLAREKGHLELADRLLRAELREIGNDVRELASLPQVLEYLEAPRRELRRTVERRFEGFAHTYQRYDQIRLLGLDGWELVRVNHRGGRGEAVPEDALQDKSDRYYFRDALTLGPDEVYVSPLDLNIEQGRVEEPHVPMIRLSTLVRDASGRPRGMVVVNYRAETMIESFRSMVTHSSNTQWMLVNQSGQFMSHPDRALEWGWMLGRPENDVARVLPELVPALAAARNMEVRSASGVHLLRTVTPALEVANGPERTGAAPEGERWTLITFVSAHAWQQQSPLRQAWGRTALAGFAIFVALAAWSLALQREQRRSLRAVEARHVAELERLARSDPMTGVANRREFFERGGREFARVLRSGDATSVLMIDIDNFKRINDTHGHAAGDTVLQGLVRTCSAQLRPHELLARMGGEEFAVLLPGADAKAGALVAERLRRAVEDARWPLARGGSLQVTVSIGVATGTGATEDLDALLLRADTNLYRAKDAGRNRVVAEVPRRSQGEPHASGERG